MLNTFSRKEFVESGFLRSRGILFVVATLAAGVSIAAPPAKVAAAPSPDAGVTAPVDTGSVDAGSTAEPSWDVSDFTDTSSAPPASDSVASPGADSGIAPESTANGAPVPLVKTESATADAGSARAAPKKEKHSPELVPTTTPSYGPTSKDPSPLLAGPSRLARHYGPTERFHWSVTGYGSIGILTSKSLQGTFDYLAGVRGFIDWRRLSVGFQYEYYVPRTQTFVSDQRSSDGSAPPKQTASTAQRAKVYLGVLSVENPAGRLRVLLGADFLFTPKGTLYSPVLSFSSRVGRGMFGFDSGFAFTAFPSWNVELRAALVIRITVVELHLGWQFTLAANYPEQYAVYSLESFLGSALGLLKASIIQGPQVGLGFGW